MKKVAFKTLGCRLNLYETDALASQFAKGPYQIVDFDQEADIYVINTCTVTGQSDQKSRQVIKQAGRANPEAITIVTGCMATQYKEKLAESSHIDYVVDNDRKTSILSLVDAHYQGEVISPDQFDRDVFRYQPADDTFHTRSFIKIQDGCDNYCTFCIVPRVRGRAVSRPPEDIFENIRRVVEFGFREIVLTGVNIGRYSYDGYDFEKLVEAILEIPGEFRVRISSIEPDGYADSFFRLFRHPKLTPHLHLCLQSGSEDILLKMRRMYTAKEFETIAGKLRDDFPNFNLTTDIIVGFPGETGEDFEKTLSMVEGIGFGHVHTFKYSIRKGTRAERLPDHIPEKTKNQRSEIIRRAAEESKRRYREQFVGKTQRVLVETITEQGFAKGYGEHYIPVVIQEKGLKKNSFYNVSIDGILTADEPLLTGKINGSGS